MIEHRLRVLDRRNRAGSVELPCALVSDRSEEKVFWFRVPRERVDHLSTAADPFLLICIFEAMTRGGRLIVEAPVSRTLLDGLDEFMRAWEKWRPNLYQRVTIEAPEADWPATHTEARTLIPFSGGLDSCHSVWNYLQHRPERDAPPIEAVMVHGFDIPLRDSVGFEHAFDNSKRILDSVGVDVFAVASNTREFRQNWEMVHGAALASVLHLFAGHFDKAMIASSHAYHTLRFPWGSNPLTDPLLSSESLQVVYDGLGWSRNEKAKAVSAWPAAMENLRPCWVNTDHHTNCGVCVRCIGTALSFACEGVTPPPILNVPSLEEGVRALDSMIWGPVITARMKDSVLDPAKRNGITAPWVTLLEAQVNRRLHGGLARRLFRRAQRIYWRISESLQPRRKNR